MNILVEKHYLTEMICGSNFAYTLSDNSAFLTTEYKVLQSQADSRFVKCMKLLYNGKIQLLYLTRTLRPFASMIPSMDADSFLTIVANLFANIIDVKHNGFLSCQNIDISFERIYVDPATRKVSLVYLPLSTKAFDDTAAFENELRTELIKLITGISTLSSAKTMQLYSDLANGTLSIEDIYGRITGGLSPIPTPPKPPIPVPVPGPGPVDPDPVPMPVGMGGMRITAMNAPTRVEISITKDSFVLGKKQGAVDGVISFNDKISRMHCRINKVGNRYTVTDLRSANGTYVNRVRLQPEQPYPIKHGDVIRLANSDFQVSIV